MDGQDEVFEEDEEYGSNAAGRFATYWTRGGDDTVFNEILLEEDINDSSLDDSGVRNNEWFICSIERADSCVIEPYVDSVEQDGKSFDVLMSSVALEKSVRSRMIP